MPNLKPPVTTTAPRARVPGRGSSRALPGGSTLRAADDALPDRQHGPGEIASAKASGFIHAVKYYPAGATTNSDSGVTALDRAYPALAAMERHGLVLSLHGEVTDADVDVFDRERVFVDRSLTRIVRDFPASGSCSSTSRRETPPPSSRRRRRTSRRRSRRSTCSTRGTRCFAGGIRPASLLPADTEARDAPAGARRGRDLGQPEVLPRHGLGAARAADEGDSVRLRRMLLGADRAAALRRSFRPRGCARSPRRLREPLRRRLLRTAAQCRHGDAAARGVDRARRVPVRRRRPWCRCAQARPTARGVARRSARPAPASRDRSGSALS